MKFRTFLKGQNRLNVEMDEIIYLLFREVPDKTPQGELVIGLKQRDLIIKDDFDIMLEAYNKLNSMWRMIDKTERSE